jgi:hypothetical protein
VKIINTQTGPALLAGKARKPSKWWLQQQIITPVPGVQWFRAYPLSGGAILIQEHLIKVERDATEAEIEAATASNPAADAIRALLP